jgi:hypothetical protein
LPRYRLVHLANELKNVADANRDGKIRSKRFFFFWQGDQIRVARFFLE